MKVPYNFMGVNTKSRMPSKHANTCTHTFCAGSLAHVEQGLGNLLSGRKGGRHMTSPIMGSGLILRKTNTWQDFFLPWLTRLLAGKIQSSSFIMPLGISLTTYISFQPQIICSLSLVMVTDGFIVIINSYS